MSKFTSSKAIFLLCVFCTAMAIGSPAQTLTTIHNFNGTDGWGSYFMSLIQGTDGNLYGTTFYGGGTGYGTVFKITADGTVTTLYSFCAHSGCADGRNPAATLVQGRNGNFYGTTVYGGNSSGYGTIFEITPNGTLTTLYRFCSQTGCTDGGGPYGGGLVQGTDGNFYGVTYFFGPYGWGTVYKITPNGTFTTLHGFAGYPTDGGAPMAGLIRAIDGNLYGTTQGGGANDCGTVFKISPQFPYTVTILNSFDTYCREGSEPQSVLVQGTDGNFYGTAIQAGAYGVGTVFKVTPAGTLTRLHSFDLTDGAYPYTGLVQGTDGNLYGTTFQFGTYGYGTVFKITPTGTFTAHLQGIPE